MKFAIVVAFAALLGNSLAGKTEVINTGAEKTVQDLIAIYELISGNVLQEGSHYRQAYSRHPRTGGKEPPYILSARRSARDDSVSGNLGSLEGSVTGPPGLKSHELLRNEGLPHVLHSTSIGRQSEGFTAGGRKQQDGLLHGDDSVGGNLGSLEGSVTGAGLKSPELLRNEGLPHVLHSTSIGRQSEGFTAGGRKQQDGLLHGDDSVGGNLGSLEGSVTGAGLKSPELFRNEGLPYVLHSTFIGRQSEGFAADGQEPQDGSLNGGLLPSHNSIGGNVEPSNNFVGGDYKLREGSATGGLPHTYDSVGTGRQSSKDFITAGLKPRDGFKDEGLSLTDDSIDGGRVRVATYYPIGKGSSDGSVGGDHKSRDGSTTGGVGLTDYSVSEGLLSDDGSTVGGQVGSDYYLQVDEYPIPADANYGSQETSEAADLSPRMKEDMDKVRTAFMLAVSSNYDGMTNRKLWKDLIRKQKQLETSKMQLRHLLYRIQESRRKLSGLPLEYHVKSKALSSAIIRDIEKLVAFRPADYSSP